MSQHLDALAKARVAKMSRAALRRRLGSGEVLLSDVFREEVPWWLSRQSIEQLLRWAPCMQPQAVESILDDASVLPTRELGQLTARQLAVLAQAMEDREEARAKGKTRRAIAERRERREVAA